MSRLKPTLMNIWGQQYNRSLSGHCNAVRSTAASMGVVLPSLNLFGPRQSLTKNPALVWTTLSVIVTLAMVAMTVLLLCNLENFCINKYFCSAPHSVLIIYMYKNHMCKNLELCSLPIKHQIMGNVCGMMYQVLTYFEKYASRFCLNDSLVDCDCDGAGKNSYVNIIGKLIR